MGIYVKVPGTFLVALKGRGQRLLFRVRKKGKIQYVKEA